MEFGYYIERLRKVVSTVIALIVLAIIFLSLPDIHDDLTHELLKVSGILLVVLAMLGRIWATVFIGGKKNRSLIQDGPYSLTRNPLYFFSFLGMIGVFFVAKHLLLCGIMIVVYLVYYQILMRQEEKKLRRMFPDEYEEWAKKTPLFFPKKPWAYNSNGERLADVDKICSSIKDALWFLFVMLLLLLVDQLRGFDYLGHWTLFPF